MDNFPMSTGYEFCRIGIEEISPEQIALVEEMIGLMCEKCHSFESNKWYIEKLINNYLPDRRLICEKCV